LHGIPIEKWNLICTTAEWETLEALTVIDRDKCGRPEIIKALGSFTPYYLLASSLET